MREEMSARKSAVVPAIADENILEILTPKPEQESPIPSPRSR